MIVGGGNKKQNMKTLKKFVALMTLAALVAGPAQALAEISTTSLTKKDVSTGDSDIPYMHVKWEMDGTIAQLTGTDYYMDTNNPGAQFKPSGVSQEDKTITVCGIASSSTGDFTKLDGVYADIYYPTTVALGPNHEDARQGCGQKITQCRMQKIDRTLGYNLFCGNIQQNNSSLLTWEGTEAFAEFCASQGAHELNQDKAAVYCCEHTLSYEDPAGKYNTVVIAQDGNLSDSLSNQFQYLSTPSYAVDFTEINYGNDVQLLTNKDVNGDFTMSNGDGKPTVQNLGNTRLRMVVWQDDMGFGKTGGNAGTWDVNYGARVVDLNGSTDMITYEPIDYKTDPTNLGSFGLTTGTQLLKELNLSQTDKMDFRVLVKKWLKDNTGTDITSYSGNLRLAAYAALPWACTADGSGTMSPTAPAPADWPGTGNNVSQTLPL